MTPDTELDEVQFKKRNFQLKNRSGLFGFIVFQGMTRPQIGNERVTSKSGRGGLQIPGQQT
jgi:hypothetical protein